jgi:hypothetical protein
MIKALSDERLAERVAASPIQKLAIFVAYFLFLMLGGVVAPQESGQPSWWITPADFLRTVEVNDARSFLNGATDIAAHGWIQAGNQWLVRLWPPGFMLLEAGALTLAGSAGPFLLVLLVFSAGCCSLWMLLLRTYLEPTLPPRVATLVPLIPFAFPLTRFFLLSPVGISLGETFAISFFLTGFLLVLLAARSGSVYAAIGAGLALSAAAYFRSQFELLVVALAAGAAIVLVMFLVQGLLVWRRGKRWTPDWRTMALMLLTLVVCHATMLPWRLHNHRDLGEYAWVQTQKLVARNSLTTEQDLLRAGGGFVIAGGGHLACKLEPSYCGQTEVGTFYRAFFKNPFVWLLEKLKRVPAYWMGPPKLHALSEVRVSPTNAERIANWLFLLCIVLGLFRLWTMRDRRVFTVQVWFHLSLYAALLAVYALAHLEARYFYLPKIFGVVALITLLPSWPNHKALRST